MADTRSHLGLNEGGVLGPLEQQSKAVKCVKLEKPSKSPPAWSGAWLTQHRGAENSHYLYLGQWRKGSHPSISVV